ncbi:MAG: ATP-dependent Clp protease ATP-binding subunit [Bacillota bacterium]|nr:ATP-dependent Clp protease ATP-binding subunit [Bacillota bacterium]
MSAFENRFTEKAKHVLSAAQSFAEKMGTGYVGSEQILLGLLDEETCFASKYLKSKGITIPLVTEKIYELIEVPNDSEAITEYTPRTKRILEISFMEAGNTGSSYIDTEHILLAIFREGQSVACRILFELGLPRNTYNDILASLTGGSAQKGAKGSSYKSADTPTLNQFGRDLTAMAKDGKFDPVIGRDKEIQRVIQILSRRTKNNPCLIGEPGVGKTAIAEGLAQQIIEGTVPETLKGKRLFTLDLSSMVAGAKYRGEFEERLKTAVDEIIKAGNVVLFIDEIHTIIGAGAAEGAIDASNILKPSLARGELQLIGATTINEYRKYIEKDPALERRFQPVMVGEPSVEETIEILKGLKDKYEAHHNVEISEEALKAAATLSARYISDRFLPDKAIDLVDEAASKARLKSLTAPSDLKETEDKLNDIKKEKDAAITSQEFEKAASLRDNEKILAEELRSKKENWSKENSEKHTTITKEDIASVLSDWTGIPVSRLGEDDAKRLLSLESILHERVIGQDDAVKAVAKAIRRGRMGLKDPKRPIGSFIFLGPTGVGKTELSKALAEAMFADEDAMIRVDMSEYMEKHSVSKLVGSPPGYVGFEEGGQLTEKIRRKPYSVILFDEIEKAHPDVFNIMLQVLDDGILTDSQGRKVDFRNTVIIMTSNIGARKITDKAKTLGFTENTGADSDYEKIKSSVMSDLKEAFRPEFLNRVDEIIVFHKLTEPEIKKITSLMLKSVAKRLESMEIKTSFNDTLIEYLAKEGYDPIYGARPLRRAIQSKVEDFIAEKMLEGEIEQGSSITLKVNDGQVTFE